VRLLVDVEQAPNPDSRITLSSKTDAFGMPLPALDWRLTGLEETTLTEYSRALAAEFAARGLGAVTLAERPDFTRRDELSAARDIYHHMGTARMSRSRDDGVTNPDLRCHDVENLFIASAAVFPTGGIANPTMTILALSLRLAEHLKRTLAHAT
jgi:choline dehydrogenase-like flavoprotein